MFACQVIGVFFGRCYVYNGLINWYYYTLLINKAELVKDNLQTPKQGILSEYI